MPQLLASTERQETLYELMFPYCVGARARRAAATTNNVSPNSAIDPSSSISPNGASTATAPVAIDLERASTNPASSDSRPPILANNDTVQSSTSSDSEIQVAIQR
ncbi:hypothetical protein BC939DRAFT_278373 [Gamsiella multidivaricata]|uniref:uncharacterized protein n=1 Tax=Gamsiella multidivaricata TaxID=101098 RepID=UPI00221F250E|nr:uncharacterized protein BC939DRAFT_278373 [Gamsiella multidivaricata]KAI7818796.1 hypothetical protein BC939DRAFT_278373 [Gamsiella multidivaricata]